MQCVTDEKCAILTISTVYGAGDTGDNTSTTLVINELMASNAGIVMSPATNFDSWIEIYNPDSKSINLSGMYLSNDANNLTRWKMPSDIGTVPAKGYLVVWMGSDDIKSNQAPFKLDCDGGTICLSDKNGRLITSVDYPEAMSRTSTPSVPMLLTDSSTTMIGKRKCFVLKTAVASILRLIQSWIWQSRPSRG